jgi:hypothetical protein
MCRNRSVQLLESGFQALIDGSMQSRLTEMIKDIYSRPFNLALEKVILIGYIR